MNHHDPINPDAPTDDPGQADDNISPPENAADSASAQPVDELTEARAQAETYLNAWKRAVADLQNYKKQQEKQRSMWAAMANQELMLALLPLFDDMHMAITNVTDEIKHSKWYEGLLLIQKKQEKSLRDAGLELIEAEGKPFDPNFHEAVLQEYVEGVASGTVTGILQPGYLLNGRVIRACMVKVAQ